MLTLHNVREYANEFYLLVHTLQKYIIHKTCTCTWTIVHVHGLVHVSR